jgi:hypothetical protein
METYLAISPEELTTASPNAQRDWLKGESGLK